MCQYNFSWRCNETHTSRTAPVSYSYFVLSCNGIETCLENKQVGPDSKEVSSLSLSFDLFWVYAKRDKFGNCKAGIRAYFLWRDQTM